MKYEVSLEAWKFGTYFVNLQIVNRRLLGDRLRCRSRHAGRLVLVAGLNKGREERVGSCRFRLELGMELHGEVPRMTGKLGDLDEFPRPVTGQRCASRVR